MRNLVMAIVGLSVVAVALPVASANAEDTVVIKKKSALRSRLAPTLR